MENERTKLNWENHRDTEYVSEYKNCGTGMEIGTRTAARVAKGWISPRQLEEKKDWGVKGRIPPRQMELNKWNKWMKTGAQMNGLIAPKQMENTGMNVKFSPRQLELSRMKADVQTNGMIPPRQLVLSRLKTLISPRQLVLSRLKTWISPRQMARTRMKAWISPRC